ncbi:ArdC-like ssDNA-binding domain-containing protein [Bartonella sp. C271]|uniref:ArdC-like ssDNA-binding domain-containing protein n=1 Tax=Bartonella sp. C271 TaxID=3070220 RepID=UPI0038B4EEA6
MIDKKELFTELVAKQLIEQIKIGTAPWQVSWRAAMGGGYMPMNPRTGNRYRGETSCKKFSVGVGEAVANQKQLW